MTNIQYAQQQRDDRARKTKDLDELRDKTLMMWEQERNDSDLSASLASRQLTKRLAQATQALGLLQGAQLQAGQLASAGQNYLSQFMDLGTDSNLAALASAASTTVHSFETSYAVNPALFDPQTLESFKTWLRTDANTAIQLDDVHFDPALGEITFKGYHLGQAQDLNIEELIGQAVAHAADELPPGQDRQAWLSLSGRALSTSLTERSPEFEVSGFTIAKNPVNGFYDLTVSGALSNGFAQITDTKTSEPVAFASYADAIERLSAVCPTLTIPRHAQHEQDFVNVNSGPTQSTSRTRTGIEF